MKTKKQVSILKPIVGLYRDSGVAPHSFFQLKKLLSPYYTVVKLKAPDLIEKNWPEAMKALVMPGGADIYYHQKLQGSGCANIRAFVEAGGIYVGVCAGSYFAAEEIYFTCSDGAVIAEKRDLGFFKGRVVGPAFGVYIEEGHISAQLVEIVLKSDTTQAYFNGGGIFENALKSEVLGRYKETNQPMALLCKVGQGYALLCAVHPEYDQEFLNSIIQSKSKGYESLKLIVQNGFDKEVKDWFLRTLSQIC